MSSESCTLRGEWGKENLSCSIAQPCADEICR